MSDFELLQDAIAFAARMHRHQLRKDDHTPYVSHVFRVAMTVATVFGIRDARVLAAAVLHDTIEDTTTDYDDLAERFGGDIASWVSSLTKEKHLADDERESRYRSRLAMAPWPVAIVKLADIYDNLSDSRHLSKVQRDKTIARAEMYLRVYDAPPAEAVEAARIVNTKLREIQGVK